VVLAVDAGASCGYAIARIDRSARKADVFEYGYMDIDTSSPFVGDWCRNLMARLDSICARIRITDVAVEDYFFSSRHKSGANVNPMYRAAIYIWARGAGLPHHTLGITNWKTFVAGRSTATREEKAAWGAERAKKLMVARALWDRHQIRFPNFSVSEATGRPIALRMDCVDAVGQALYAAHMIYACRDFSCSVPVPPDHSFPKTAKRLLDYSEFASIGDASVARPQRRRKAVV
jgi:Holliday junction resolvasome RuvABC endonuclease subunit